MSPVVISCQFSAEQKIDTARKPVHCLHKVNARTAAVLRFKGMRRIQLRLPHAGAQTVELQADERLTLLRNRVFNAKCALDIVRGVADLRRVHTENLSLGKRFVLDLRA